VIDYIYMITNYIMAIHYSILHYSELIYYIMVMSSTEAYLLVIAISGSLHVLTKVFTVLRKSSCMMCGGCCLYSTNNDDEVTDLEKGDDNVPLRGDTPIDDSVAKLP
jgi:hypothetical protein